MLRIAGLTAGPIGLKLFVDTHGCYRQKKKIFHFFPQYAQFEVTLHAKMAMINSQQYPWKLYLINNVENIVVFLDWKVCISDIITVYFFCRRNPPVQIVEKPQLKIISFQNYKHLILTWSHKAFTSTVVNQA